MIERIRILIVISLRSLWAHKVKSGIVGLILAFGTCLVVIGSALLDSMEDAMARSVTSSMSGHLQVYAADAKDELSLFGSFGMGQTDIGEIEDFAKVEQTLGSVDNVTAVVPMGITIATVFGGNEIDLVLADLRDAVRDDDRQAIPVLVGRVRQIASNFARDNEKRVEIAIDPEKVKADGAMLDRAMSDELWAEFDRDPYAVLDFLDAELAPLAFDGRLMYLRILGTDPEQYPGVFDRFKLLQGEMIPAGQRGIVLSDRQREEFLKNLVARQLDQIIKETRAGTAIADDPELQVAVSKVSRQYSRVTNQLTPADAALLETKLRDQLPGVQGDLATLVQEFLKVDDHNIEARYKFFYDEIATKIRLYDVNVGDTLSLRAYTKSGYLRSVNAKVWGIFTFSGLEDSDLAAAANITDLETFRELYGRMSDQQKAELQDIKAEVGVRDVSREDAEAALFGGGELEATVAPTEASAFDAAFAPAPVAAAGDAAIDPAAMRSGLVLNAAVIVDDLSRLAQTRRDVEAAIAREQLNLQVVDWQSATGILGQFVVTARMVLYAMIFVVFLVALVIIQNTMAMATIERTPEIGTMRAVGARRGFVTTMFLVETVVLGVIAGGMGAAVGVAVVAWLGTVGIPAGEGLLMVLFAGPKLYPGVGVDDVAFGLTVIVGVSLLATFYPALVAARVPPVVAMQGKES